MSQLHTDLQQVRKSRKMSIQDVYDKTRLSLENIEKIEDGSIYHSDRNITYVRSFIRTYGRGIGINDSDMIEALDKHEAGSYDGSIRTTYLGGSKEAPSDTSGAASPEKPKTEPPASTKPKSVPPSPGKESTPGPSKPEPSVEPAEKQKPRPKVLDGSSIGPGKTGPINVGGSHVSPPPKTGDVNWSDLGRRAAQKPTIPVVPIIAGVVILLLLGILLYWLISSSDEYEETGVVPDATETIQPDESRASSLLSDTLDAPVPPDPARAGQGSLPDTLHVVVYAARGNLEPFRVSSDTFDNRRPYWIEQGKGMRIAFVNEVRLSGSMNRMLVLYDDRVITEFDEINQQGERILRRSQFESDPSLESFTQSALPDDISEPGEIIDRPVIN